MGFFEIVFAAFFFLAFILPFFRKKKKKDSDPKPEKMMSPKPKAGASTYIVDKHAEWDEAAWGKSKGGSNRTLVDNGSGHNIPSWDKPTAAKRPELGARPERAARPEITSSFGRTAPDINLDENIEKMGLGYFVVILVIIANLVAFIYYGYSEFLAADQIGGIRAAFNVHEVPFEGAYSWYLNIGMAGVVLAVLGLIGLLFQWFDKSMGAPNFFVSLFIFMMVFVVADALAYNYFFPYSGFEGAIIDYRDLMVVIGFVCFMPYIWLAKSVKATFNGT